MELLQNVPPIVAIILGFLLLVWLVLVLLVPFMIEGIRTSTRRTHEELAEMNEKLDRLNALLAQHGGTPSRPAGQAEPTPEPQAPEGGAARRREPTISETPARGAPRNRKEPTVR